MAEKKNKSGRPPKEIPKEEFEKLCGLQCKKEEICDFFDITDKTLEKWCKRTYIDEEDGHPMGFSEVFAQKRGKGKIALRRAQFELAKKNANMAIWLGKQWLGQTDKTENINKNYTSLDLSKISTEEIKAMLDDEV